MKTKQNPANSKPGPPSLPARVNPVPDTASPQLQAAIAAPYCLPAWNANPKSTAEWKELGVNIESTVIGRVKVYILTPKELLSAN